VAFAVKALWLRTHRPMAAHALTDGLDPVVARKREIFRSIKEGFALFDPEKKGMCDVREIGTIVRHLGINPTEIELRDMITEIEEEEPTGFIAFERFERMMQRIMLENQYPRDSEEKLLRAFRTLDPENKGYVEADKIRTLLTTHGERFSQEEIEDFLHFAVDAESGVLHYEGTRRATTSMPRRHMRIAAPPHGVLFSPCLLLAAHARRLRGAGRAVRRRARRPFWNMRS
jgi:Ca2+-binding EF-hand superfamily protein